MTLLNNVIYILTPIFDEPTIDSLKQDLNNSNTYHSGQVAKITHWLDKLEARPLPKCKDKFRSRVVPKLIRKQAEWRYASLSEPFLSTPNIFKVNPVSYEDGYSARQNELVLNYQFNTQINKIKFIDDYVRSAVDTGTAILRVDWKNVLRFYILSKCSYALGECITASRRRNPS